MTEELEPDLVVAALQASLDAVTEAEEALGRLDAAAGDGDHGRGMVRGFRAAVAAAQEAGTGPMRLQQAGFAFSDAAGGASGMLYGTILETLGGSLSAGSVDARTVGEAFRRALQEVSEVGGAEVGDKTLIDALAPFVERFLQCAEEDQRIADCWRTAVDAAEAGAAGTAALVARRGRAARLGERGRGSADPGATSMALVLAAAGGVIADRCATA